MEALDGDVMAELDMASEDNHTDAANRELAFDLVLPRDDHSWSEMSLLEPAVARFLESQHVLHRRHDAGVLKSLSLLYSAQPRVAPWAPRTGGAFSSAGL